MKKVYSIFLYYYADKERPQDSLIHLANIIKIYKNKDFTKSN